MLGRSFRGPIESYRLGRTHAVTDHATSTVEQDLETVIRLGNSGHPRHARRRCLAVLEHDPDNPLALALAKTSDAHMHRANTAEAESYVRALALARPDILRLQTIPPSCSPGRAPRNRRSPSCEGYWSNIPAIAPWNWHSPAVLSVTATPNWKRSSSTDLRFEQDHVSPWPTEDLPIP
jgi:hypothetical protein